MIPQSFIDEVKNNTDILAVISANLPAGSELKRSGGNYVAPCPFHHEKTASFTVTPEKGMWYCFGACAEGGDVIKFLMKRNPAKGFTQVLRELSDKAGMDWPEESQEVAEEAAYKKRLLELLGIVAKGYHNTLMKSPKALPARQYIMAARELSLDTVEKFMLGYAPREAAAVTNAMLERGYSTQELIDAGISTVGSSGDINDRFKDRLMFPIKDYMGRVVGFGGRAISGQSPKYLNSPQSTIFNKGNLLYGLSEGSGFRQCAVVVEGYMDVLQAVEAGLTNVCAQMGTSLTQAQLRLLARHSDRATVIMDGDAAGVEATIKTARNAHQWVPDFPVSALAMPAGQDPDDVLKYGREKWDQLQGDVIPILHFAAKAIAGRYDLKTPDGRTKAIDEVLPMMVGLRPTDIDYYAQTVGELFGIGAQAIKQEIVRYNQKGTAAAIVPSTALPNSGMTTGQILLALLQALGEEPDADVSGLCKEIKLTADDFMTGLDGSVFTCVTSWGADSGSPEDAYITDIFAQAISLHLIPDTRVEVEEQIRNRTKELKEQSLSITLDMLTIAGQGDNGERITRAAELLRQVNYEPANA